MLRYYHIHHPQHELLKLRLCHLMKKMTMNSMYVMDSLLNGHQVQSGILMHMGAMHLVMTQWDGHQLGLRAQPTSNFNQWDALNFWKMQERIYVDPVPFVIQYWTQQSYNDLKIDQPRIFFQIHLGSFSLLDNLNNWGQTQGQILINCSSEHFHVYSIY